MECICVGVGGLSGSTREDLGSVHTIESKTAGLVRGKVW